MCKHRIIYELLHNWLFKKLDWKNSYFFYAKTFKANFLLSLSVKTISNFEPGNIWEFEWL